MLKRLRGGEDFDSFLRDNHDKTVLVKFVTAWCGPCKSLHANIEKLLTELEQSTPGKNNLVVLEVDAENFSQLAQRPDFNIHSVPTIFLFAPQKVGEKEERKWLKKATGSLSMEKLKEFIGV